MKNFRKIKSFVLREGRLTKGQASALEKLWPSFGLVCGEDVIDLSKVFHREATTVLEVGFGMGASLVQQACEHPEINFIGVEVHRPGVGALLLGVEQHQLTNVRVYQHDAVEVLKNCIADYSLDKIQIYFPDPWPKKRHHKRRLIQQSFVGLLHQKIKSGGILHLATDWKNYAEHMMEVMNAVKGFKNLAGEGNYSPRPECRPETKFERRGLKLGHGVWDLLFIQNTVE